MKITDLRIKNFRTIASDQTVRLAHGATLVGPNNSGKTNLLKGLQMFFTGYENTHGYDRSVDLTFGAGRQQTSLIATFTLDNTQLDTVLADQLDDLHRLLATDRESETFSISLYFTDTNTPVYRVFSNQKLKSERDRAAFSRLQKKFVETVLGRFRCHLVPSAKSIEGLYEEILHPFLIRVASKTIAPHLEAIQYALGDVADSLNAELENAGLERFTASFALPGDSAENALAGFDFLLTDPKRTSIWAKGQGVQSAALFASFHWVTRQEQADGLIPIWLIEEPESYLHPELAKSCHEILESLASASTVVTTTHSLAFTPSKVERIHGVDLDAQNRTVVSTFGNRAVATKRIRESLGVNFSDYYNMAGYNVFTEGPSDKTLIEWALTQIPAEVAELRYLRSALIQEHGGVVLLEGFLRATFALMSGECALVSVFDGDDAGQKSRRALQNLFGQKGIRFESNEQFVSVRTGFAIEGLFPDSWIIELHATNPSWFSDFAVDSQLNLEPFSIKDANKKSAIGSLRNRAETDVSDEWIDRWLIFLTRIDEALRIQGERLSRQGNAAYDDKFPAFHGK